MDFPLRGKNGLKFSTNDLFDNNVRGEYRAVIALKKFVTESFIQWIYRVFKKKG